MKQFEVYRNIRKKAMIYGLPIGLFALMMLSIIGSLLVMIFSFSLGVIALALIFNLGLFFLLTRISAQPHLLNFQKVFPPMVSNKKSSGLRYEG